MQPKKVSPFRQEMAKREAKWLSSVLPFPVYAKKKMTARDGVLHEAAHAAVAVHLKRPVHALLVGQTATGSQNGLFLAFLGQNPRNHGMALVAGAAKNGWEGMGLADARGFFQASRDASVEPKLFFRQVRREVDKILALRAGLIEEIADELEKYGIVFWDDLRPIVRRHGIATRKLNESEANWVRNFGDGFIREECSYIFASQERVRWFMQRHDEATRAAARKAKETAVSTSESEISCPHCEAAVRYPGEVFHGADDNVAAGCECDSCSKTFTLRRKVETTYTATREPFHA